MIISEKQQVKGISRIVAVTGQDAVQVGYGSGNGSAGLKLRFCGTGPNPFRWSLQARDMGRALSQEVDSLSARLSGSAPSSLGSALQFSKEASALSDVGVLPMMQCSSEATV